MKEIYKIKYGADAYGTKTSTSDTDIRGILLPSIEECLSLKEHNDFRQDSDNIDIVLFPIQKFFKLALESNPSVVEWLYVHNNNILLMTPAGKIIRDNRLLFLSKKAYVKFKGYAYQEFTSLTKMTGETGDKRRQDILKFGYSPKNAMNSIRLLYEGIELLTTANLTLPFKNASELLDIKLGKLRYEQIVSRFDELLKELDKAKDVSPLPENSRWDDANNLMIRIIKDFQVEGLSSMDQEEIDKMYPN